MQKDRMGFETTPIQSKVCVVLCTVLLHVPDVLISNSPQCEAIIVEASL